MGSGAVGLGSLHGGGDTQTSEGRRLTATPRVLLVAMYRHGVLTLSRTKIRGEG